MLTQFFFAMRAAKLPVSIKEHLALLEAFEANVIGPGNPDACSLEDFYFLSRTILVKDEKHYDKFDRAFSAYFQGVDTIADFSKPIPAEWLRKEIEKLLSDADKKNAPKVDYDDLLETLKKRLEEQKERHQGGSKWVGTGGTSPFGNSGHNSQGVRIGGKGGNKSAVKVWEKRAYRDYDDSQELGTRTTMSFALSFTANIAQSVGLSRGTQAKAARRQGAFVVEAKQNKESRAKQSMDERLYNKARKSEITTRMKKVFLNAQSLMASDACSENDISGLEKLISEATKAVDKAVARGVLHKNTGARRKARMSKFKMDVRTAKGLYSA